MDERKDYCWCVDCGARFTREEVLAAQHCPKCENEGVPAGVSQDVLVEVNWHELRILTMWAENWARHCKEPKMPKTVQAIARRLEMQFPDFPALTLSGEIAQLPQALDKAGIGHGEIESNVPKPPLVVVNGNGAVGYGRVGKMMVGRGVASILPRGEN